MGEFFGMVMRGLGSLLAAFYSLTGSFALAIILVTLLVRTLLLPLMIKQFRSMSAMQALQPEMKAIQQKYKALQKKARDRAELQQIRLEMQKEQQALFRQHGVNPAAGCLPLLAQMPVFIAMFSVMRAAMTVTAAGALIAGPTATLTPATFGDDLGKVVCRPADPQTRQPLIGEQIDVAGSAPTIFVCPGAGGEQVVIEMSNFQDPRTGEDRSDAGWITACQPFEQDGNVAFRCRSSLGTGHLPQDSALFRDVSKDQATILGMHPQCTPTQVNSEESARQCTTDPDAGGPLRAAPYYLLVLLIAASGYYAARQMMRRPGAQQQQQTPGMPNQATMAKIFPVMFALISLQFPTGLNFYYLFINLTQVGQQHFQIKSQLKSQQKNQPASATIVDERPKAPEPAPKEIAPKTPRPQGSKKRKKKKKR